MRNRVVSLALLAAVLLSGGTGWCQVGASTAEKVTRPDRGLGRALREVLREGPGQARTGAQEKGEEAGRVLMILLDPTPALQGTALLAKMESALQGLGDRLKDTRIGLRRVGDKRGKLLAPSLDRKALLRALGEAVVRTSPGFHDCYKELRSLAIYLGKLPGRREILLVNLDNPDVEGGLEKTVRLLRKNGIRLSVITREAYISDPYWEARSYEKPPRGTRFFPADGPFIDLPWGWIFQMSSPGEVSPSGFAVYGMNRLAAATGGKVYLFSPQATSSHSCGYSSSCPFCSGDHLQASEEFWDGRVNQLAPLVVSRKEAFRLIVSDPAYRAVDRAWREAARAGLIRSLPSIQLGKTSASPQRRKARGWASLMSSLNLKGNAKKADRLRADCTRILANMEGMLERSKKGRSAPRSLAAAALTRFELQLAIVNLVTYAAWCREVAPRLLAEMEQPPPPPEVSWSPAGKRPVGIGYSNLSLCHGVEPFERVQLPGGALLRKELARLQNMRQKIEERYGHTGYAFGLHRAGIAVFYFTFPGLAKTPRRPRNKSKKKDTQTAATERGRPSRAGGRSGGRSGGARTGGGR